MAISTKPPAGMRDFLPDLMSHRKHVIGVVESIYARYGFEPLETPAVENLSTLLGKYGEEGDQLVFRILHRGEKLTRVLEGAGEAPVRARDLGDLGLRYDLTVPLARVVAQYGAKLPKFFRRYQIQPVWRADRPARGRFREFYQCDVDVVGSASMAVEVELLSAVCEVFDALGFEGVTIRLNHRQLLSALVAVAGIPSEQEAEALVSLDKLDKIGEEGVRAELASRGISSAAVEALVPLLSVQEHGGPEATLSWVEGLLGTSKGGDEAARVRGVAGIGDLRQILALSERTPARGRLRIDPVLARGLSYYTGPIFEVTVADLPGSLAGGGRYDELIGMFSGRPVPACGIALGLERILVVMQEREMFAPGGSAPEVLVTCFGPEGLGDSLALAAALRRQGTRVECYPEPTKLGKQLKYASVRGIPLAAIVAPDELARGEVTFKDLDGGTQHSVSREAAGGWVRQRLTAREDS